MCRSLEQGCDVAPGRERAALLRGKCAMSVRTSPSVVNVSSFGMTSGRGSFRFQSARSGPLVSCYAAFADD
jgi:hypothetical protein